LPLATDELTSDMRILFFILIGASAALGVWSAVCFIRRRVMLGVGLSGALVGSLALGYFAATQSDPPSLLPLWGWMAGLCLGAIPGLLLNYATKKSAKRLRNSLFLIVAAAGSVLYPASGMAAEDHFVGKYAYAATPFWFEFEIVRNGHVFTAREPGGSKFAEFMATNGVLVSQAQNGEDFSLRYERSNGMYVLAGKTHISTLQGNREVPVRRAVRKLMPRRDKELEEQFGVTAAALVKQVRQSERWMHEFTTLRFSAEIAWTRTPAGIEYRKREIHAQSGASRGRSQGGLLGSAAVPCRGEFS